MPSVSSEILLRVVPLEVIPRRLSEELRRELTGGFGDGGERDDLDAVVVSAVAVVAEGKEVPCVPHVTAAFADVLLVDDVVVVDGGPAADALSYHTILSFFPQTGQVGS